LATQLNELREQVRAKAQALLDKKRSQREKREEFEANRHDKWWRLNNLYYIVDANMKKVRFKPNWAQKELFDELGEHPKIISLKARQLGMSTFIRIDDLDSALWEPNTQCGLIADTLDNAKALLQNKDKYALENMDDWIVPYLPEVTKQNETELRFSNGSFIVVGISLRSGTYGRLHISEYGKICARFPKRGTEIRTGALNTVAPDGVVRIESTAEGSTGDFYDKCQEVLNRAENAVVSKLQYNLLFSPWWREDRYRIPANATPISKEDEKYFAKLEKKLGATFHPDQKAWYVDKKREQNDEMLREFPSTEEEAFQGASEGQYYAKHILAAEREGRICEIRPNSELPVYTFWDLGLNDQMVVWFMQFGSNEQRNFFDVYANTGYGLAHYVGIVKEKQAEYGFHTYGKHVLPHDAGKRNMGKEDDPTTTADDLRELGLVDIEVMRRGDLYVGINNVRRILPMCSFDGVNCKKGIDALRAYRRVWDDGKKAWSDTPLHDWASDFADAFRSQIGFVPGVVGMMEYDEDDFRTPNVA